MLNPDVRRGRVRRIEMLSSISSGQVPVVAADLCVERIAVSFWWGSGGDIESQVTVGCTTNIEQFNWLSLAPGSAAPDNANGVPLSWPVRVHPYCGVLRFVGGLAADRWWVSAPAAGLQSYLCVYEEFGGDVIPSGVPDDGVKA